LNGFFSAGIWARINERRIGKEMVAMRAYEDYIAELFTFDDPFFRSTDLDFDIDIQRMEKTVEDMAAYMNRKPAEY
jgi:hypothetical protein